MQIPTNCYLYSIYDETRDHLLLRCEYSDVLWRSVQRRLGLTDYTFFTGIPSCHGKICTLALLLPRYENLKPKVQSTIYERSGTQGSTHTNPRRQLSYSRDIRDTILARRLRKNFKNLMALRLQWE